MGPMQPNAIPVRPTDPSRRRRPPVPARPPIRWRALAATFAAALGLTLAACGGSSDASSDTTSDTASAADAAATSTPTDDGGVATTAAPATGDLDLCAEVSKDEVAAILTEAELTAAAPNDAISAPNCGYAIEIDAGGSPMVADVVSIVWNDASYFDSQKELQTDEVDLTGLDGEAFSFDDGGMILVRGESGTFEITRGVELTAGGQPATDEQMTAIAALVAGQ